jgi:hypothetical protein
VSGDRKHGVIAAARVSKLDQEGLARTHEEQPILVGVAGLEGGRGRGIGHGLEGREAAGRSQRKYKGRASYWSARVGDAVFEDLVWSYPAPIPERPKIENLMSFYNEKVDVYVDDQLQSRPLPRS